MLETIELKEMHWQVAHAVAIELVKQQLLIEPNSDGIRTELEKIISYFRAYIIPLETGEKFFKYLNELENNGHKFGGGTNNKEYYTNIKTVCHKHLKDYQNDVPVLLQILGWVVRLMRYYKNAVPMGELDAFETAAPIQSEDRAKIAEFSAAQKFTVGQHLEATITGINGNRVSCKILGVIDKTHKEPRLAEKLKPGQKVQVEIVKLTEDGIIDKVKIIS
jgi:hypothetical protein